MPKDFIEERMAEYDDADTQRRREMFQMLLSLNEHYHLLLKIKDDLLRRALKERDV